MSPIEEYLQTLDHADLHPVPDFRWRDRHAKWWLVKDMETRHLFFTVRMIWNHTVPSDIRISPFNKYRFGPMYTSEYMRQAVAHMLAELANRDDIRLEWRDQLAFMFHCWAEGKLGE